MYAHQSEVRRLAERQDTEAVDRQEGLFVVARILVATVRRSVMRIGSQRQADKLEGSVGHMLIADTSRKMVLPTEFGHFECLVAASSSQTLFCSLLCRCARSRFAILDVKDANEELCL
jgi:hypothetical protein